MTPFSPSRSDLQSRSPVNPAAAFEQGASSKTGSAALQGTAAIARAQRLRLKRKKIDLYCTPTPRDVGRIPVPIIWHNLIVKEKAIIDNNSLRLGSIGGSFVTGCR